MCVQMTDEIVSERERDQKQYCRQQKIENIKKQGGKRDALLKD